jgi:hypothetical protein
MQQYAMHGTGAMTDRPVSFQRRNLLLDESSPQQKDEEAVQKVLEPGCRALVINASHEMASAMRAQLEEVLDECEITFAPSIELARWLLKRQTFELVVTSSILPDGNPAKLRDTIATLEHPPAVVVVGDLTSDDVRRLGDDWYAFSSLQVQGRQRETLQDRISSLGADLRDQLNNPLQEIVAMVFIAQRGGEGPELGDKALHAIDRAAKNLAGVVSRLEDRIRECITDR